MTIKSKKIKDEFAYVATATVLSPNKQGKRTSNIQLKSWIDAKHKYAKIKENNNPTIDDMILIVNLLGDSLTYLFGANYNTDNRTPPLKDMVDKIFPSRGWDLKSDNLNLYNRFCELDEFHKDVSKHFSRPKIPKAANLTVKKLEQHMKTACEIWIWFLNKYYSGNIPHDQLIEFKSYLSNQTA